MWTRIKSLLEPPVFEGDEEKTSSARLIYRLLQIIIVLMVMLPIFSALVKSPVHPMVGWLIIIVIATALGLGLLLRSGLVTESGVILTLMFWGVFTFAAYYFGGLHDISITGLLFVVVLSGLIGGWQLLATFSGLSIFTIVGLYILEHLDIITPNINTPPDARDLAMPLMVILVTTFLLQTFIGYLTKAFADARSSAQELEQTNIELTQSRDTLVKQTAALERHTRYLEAITLVAQEIASELDPETLLRRVAMLISNQFGFYHTGIFLIDPSGKYAVLKAASSRGGQRMLERNHRLQVGQEGIVGHVAETGQSRIALDTGQDAVYFDNPDLPKTHSEAALPLKTGNRVIGVLDVQSVESKAFNDDDIVILETLANQIATALQTAQLFQQVGESLKAQQQTYAHASRMAWQRLSQEQTTPGYRYINGNVVPIQDDQPPDEPDLPEITIPISLGEQTIGQITAHKPSAQDSWSDNEIAIIETLVEQLSVALESARLYEETQRRAAQEQLIGEITARVRETLDIETILRTASEEIRRALSLPEVIIQLGAPPEDPNPGMQS